MELLLPQQTLHLKVIFIIPFITQTCYKEMVMLNENCFKFAHLLQYVSLIDRIAIADQSNDI